MDEREMRERVAGEMNEKLARQREAIDEKTFSEGKWRVFVSIHLRTTTSWRCSTQPRRRERNETGSLRRSQKTMRDLPTLQRGYTRS